MSFPHVKLLPTSTFGRLFFAFLLGAIGGGAMGPLYLWYNLVIALSFLWVVFTSFSEDARWKSFACGWAFGFGYFVYSLYWIGNALLVDGNPYQWVYPLAVCGLPAGLAIFHGLATYATRWIHAGRAFLSYIVFLISFMAVEYLRGNILTGFPWNLFGMAWTSHLPMLQILSVGGIYLLTFLSIFIMSAPGFAFVGTSKKLVRFGVLALAIGLTIGLYIFGLHRLSQHPTQYRDDVIVQLMQPNIPQSEKWDNNLMWDNFRISLNLLRRDSDLHSKNPNAVRVLVMPETAMTYHHLNADAGRDSLKGALGHFKEKTYLLSGALLKDKNGWHNSLIALNQNAEMVYQFDKFHLVPFGEYIPFQKYIPISSVTSFTGFVEGDGPHTALIDGVPPFSPLVCYEVIFPGHVTTDNPERPQWIVNVTNDGWYGLSPGPFQHMAQAIYRAIEEGVPVVRSANTGISTVIDPYGRIVSLIPLGSRYTEDTFLPEPAPEQPLYSRYKNFK